MQQFTACFADISRTIKEINAAVISPAIYKLKGVTQGGCTQMHAPLFRRLFVTKSNAENVV